MDVRLTTTAVRIVNAVPFQLLLAFQSLVRTLTPLPLKTYPSNYLSRAALQCSLTRYHPLRRKIDAENPQPRRPNLFVRPQHHWLHIRLVGTYCGVHLLMDVPRRSPLRVGIH